MVDVVGGGDVVGDVGGMRTLQCDNCDACNCHEQAPALCHTELQMTAPIIRH